LSHDSFGGTANYLHSVGWRLERAQLRAAGWQPHDGDSHDGRKNLRKQFNGGITRQLVKRLQRGHKLFRFTPSGPIDLGRQVAGEWWFDQEACIFLWSKSGGTDNGFRNAARAAFCVLPEWGDMGNCVSGFLTADFWAITGTSARADGKGGSLHNPYGVDCLALFVPGGLSPSNFADLRPVGLGRLKY
jgi:hypothetical protein